MYKYMYKYTCSHRHTAAWVCVPDSVGQKLSKACSKRGREGKASLCQGHGTLEGIVVVQAQVVSKPTDGRHEGAFGHCHWSNFAGKSKGCNGRRA